MLEKKKRKRAQKQLQDRERLSQFFNLLLKIDRRINPKLYEKEEQND